MSGGGDSGISGSRCSRSQLCQDVRLKRTIFRRKYGKSHQYKGFNFVLFSEGSEVDQPPQVRTDPCVQVDRWESSVKHCSFFLCVAAGRPEPADKVCYRPTVTQTTIIKVCLSLAVISTFRHRGKLLSSRPFLINIHNIYLHLYHVGKIQLSANR